MSCALYLEMISKRTATLIGAATQIGAVLSTDDSDLVENLHRFGRAIGLAFQVVDDILGIWGEPSATGKPAANDIYQHKKSLPIVYALGRARGQELSELYQKETFTAEDVRHILGILTEVGARHYAQKAAEGYCNTALLELRKIQTPTRAQEKLSALARLLIARVSQD